MRTIIINGMNKKREIGDFPGITTSNGWEVLEVLTTAKNTQRAFYKEFWTLPGNKIRNKVIITVGEWNPKLSDQPNRFFVKGSNFSSEYHLFKYIKLESAEKKVMDMMEATDKKYDQLYSEWTDKYNFDPNKPEPENYVEPVWY